MSRTIFSVIFLLSLFEVCSANTWDGSWLCDQKSELDITYDFEIDTSLRLNISKEGEAFEIYMSTYILLDEIPQKPLKRKMFIDGKYVALWQSLEIRGTLNITNVSFEFYPMEADTKTLFPMTENSDENQDELLEAALSDERWEINNSEIDNFKLFRKKNRSILSCRRHEK